MSAIQESPAAAISVAKAALELQGYDWQQLAEVSKTREARMIATAAGILVHAVRLAKPDEVPHEWDGAQRKDASTHSGVSP